MRGRRAKHLCYILCLTAGLGSKRTGGALQKKIQAIYRASCAPNTVKAVEITEETATGKNRAQNRGNRRKTGRV